MIYTLTLNPSVDYIVKLENFELGKLNRTVKEAKFPGGKGINVSRVLKQFGVNSKALGFVGGFTGIYIENFLINEEIEPDFVRIAEDSRINIKLKTELESEINALGPKITEEDFQALKDKIFTISAGDVLVLAGSIPGSLPESAYEQLIQICKQKAVHFVVDTEGEFLLKVLAYKPFLIKPNHHELGELFHTSLSSVNEVIPYGKKLIEMGAKNVIVSLADKGAVFINNETVLAAEVPVGQVKNSVGAGDSMVAGFLAALESKGDIKEAFRYCVASGSATAFSLGLCTKDTVESLLPQVLIRELL